MIRRGIICVGGPSHGTFVPLQSSSLLHSVLVRSRQTVEPSKFLQGPRLTSVRWGLRLEQNCKPPGTNDVVATYVRRCRYHAAEVANALWNRGRWLGAFLLWVEIALYMNEVETAVPLSVAGINERYLELV